MKRRCRWASRLAITSVDVTSLHLEPRRHQIKRTFERRALKDEECTDHLHPGGAALRWAADDDVARTHRERLPAVTVPHGRPISDQRIPSHARRLPTRCTQRKWARGRDASTWQGSSVAGTQRTLRSSPSRRCPLGYRRSVRPPSSISQRHNHCDASFFVEYDFFDCRRRSPSSHETCTTHGFLRSSRRYTVPLAMGSPGAIGRILLPKCYPNGVFGSIVAIRKRSTRCFQRPWQESDLRHTV